MENKKIIKISLIAAVIFMITSSTPVFSVVGKMLGLDYENTDRNDPVRLLSQDYRETQQFHRRVPVATHTFADDQESSPDGFPCRRHDTGQSLIRRWHSLNLPRHQQLPRNNARLSRNNECKEISESLHDNNEEIT